MNEANRRYSLRGRCIALGVLLSMRNQFSRYIDGVDQWQPHVSHRCHECGDYFAADEPMIGRLPPQAGAPASSSEAPGPPAGDFLPIHSSQVPEFTLDLALIRLRNVVSS